jgi:HK97 gp10 family phage protein
VSELVVVKGLSELQAFLDQLPAKMERNVVRGGLRAGARVVMGGAKAIAPMGEPSARNAKRYGGRLGALRDSIRVKTGARGGKVTASVVVGGKGKWGADVYYARFVEYGTRPHWITSRNGGALSIGGMAFVKAVEHPGARPHPFMRPALDTYSGAAVVAAAEYMRDRLATKHGLDTAELDFEAEE